MSEFGNLKKVCPKMEINKKRNLKEKENVMFFKYMNAFSKIIRINQSTSKNRSNET